LILPNFLTFIRASYQITLKSNLQV